MSKKIYKTTEIIAECWKQFPSLRLGQLIENACGANIFYMEDSELTEKLSRYCEEMKQFAKSNP